MLALDLEQYDYSKGSTSLIRATEGTILERIPPRVRIRSGAPLELPHILVLIDDPTGSVIEPLVARRRSLCQLYDFELMLGSGHLTGYAAEDERLQAEVMDALGRLGDPDVFSRKYGLPPGTPPLVFAMGDGNHSLATAKAIWEDVKGKVGMDHPARYTLVEIENIHDAGLEFEPIHRVLFEVQRDLSRIYCDFYPNRCHLVPCASSQIMINLVNREERLEHAFGVVSPSGCHVAYVANPPSNLPVGTLQTFLTRGARRGASAKSTTFTGPTWQRAWVLSPGTWASIFRPLRSRVSSRRSFSMAHCRARPSPWAKRRKNASTWNRGVLSERRAGLRRPNAPQRPA